jgi:hypothetical protein
MATKPGAHNLPYTDHKTQEVLARLLEEAKPMRSRLRAQRGWRVGNAWLKVGLRVVSNVGYECVQ